MGEKDIALKGFATKYILTIKIPPFSLPTMLFLCFMFFLVDNGVDVCPNFGLTSCNQTFLTSTPLAGKCISKQKCGNILFFFLSGHSTL